MKANPHLAITLAAVFATTSVFAAAPKPAAPKPAAPKPASSGHSSLYDWLVKFDKNKNGKAEPDELAAVQAEFLKGDFLAGKLDTNANGKIDEEEMNKVLAEKAAIPAPKKAPAKKKK